MIIFPHFFQPCLYPIYYAVLKWIEGGKKCEIHHQPVDVVITLPEKVTAIREFTLQGSSQIQLPMKLCPFPAAFLPL